MAGWIEKTKCFRLIFGSQNPWFFHFNPPPNQEKMKISEKIQKYLKCISMDHTHLNFQVPPTLLHETAKGFIGRPPPQQDISITMFIWVLGKFPVYDWPQQGKYSSVTNFSKIDRGNHSGKVLQNARSVLKFYLSTVPPCSYDMLGSIGTTHMSSWRPRSQKSGPRPISQMSHKIGILGPKNR